MIKNWKNGLMLIITFAFLFQKQITAQDINVKIGFRDSIKSEVLRETRNILIHLPSDYYSSNKSYPIMYQLDGDDELLFATTAIINRLSQREEIIPEIIVVAIKNTNRSRDMWPTNTKYYPEPHIAGAKNFLDFIEKELVPYIENKYRTNENKILCGQSLSAVFTLYALLTKPQLFNSYIACSGAFPACEDYFKELSLKTFQQKEQFNGLKIFITNGLRDELDPNGKMNQTMVDFSNSIENNLENNITYKYLTYKNEGHVPFQSIYHGLKFVFESNNEK
jgi:predicted alpha/beta superfamily hydrolase